MRAFPTNQYAASDLVTLFRKQLELCKVVPGETVLLFTDPQFAYHYPAAMFAAVQTLGAHVLLMTVPSGLSSIDYPGVIEAWKAADMVIGMTSIPWLLSETHNEVRRAGKTRTLMVQEPIATLRRLFPCREVQARAIAGAQRLAEGKMVRFVSDAGTDLVVDKTGVEARYHCGISDTPGRWDQWPQGHVLFRKGSGDGVIVVDGGDMFLGSYGLHGLRKHLSRPVRLTIRDMCITQIEGGGEAQLLRHWYAHQEDERAYWPAHFGWGTDPRADWTVIGMDGEIMYGAVTFSFGNNLFWPGGGDNDTPTHMDFCCLNHSVYIDDELIIDHGKILPEGLR
jgi:2,5-dihydroxypyridine 5,6-dioxygenase